MRRAGPDKALITNHARIEDELEQLRVSVEDAREEAAALAAERDALRTELATRSVQLREVEARLRQREQAGEAARMAVIGNDQVIARHMSERDATAEELRVAVEELQVLAEELEESNNALTHTNAALEERVAERTAELAALNRQLRDSEERLRLAQRYAGAGTWDWDIPGGRLSWSREYFDLCGLDPETVEPSYEAWIASVALQDRAATEAALQDCLRRRDPDFRVEYRINHSQRGERWLTGRGRLICDDKGDPVRLIGLNIDITDRKRAELAIAEVNEGLKREVEEEAKAREAAQARLFQTLKLEALGQLTGGVAHDFNNLLSVITNGVGLLRRGADEARQARLLDAMEQAARRGAELTRRLLSFARRQALRPEPLDVQAWLQDMRELLARALRGDIAIEIEVPEDLWWARVDPGELELAVLNLGVNARDAMPQGGTLRICAENVELDALTDPDRLGGPFVRLSVTDTGTGMPPEVLARVFEPFFSTKDIGQGTGLGLAQVYGFARQSGGTARVRSRLGEGTTVTLLLPRAAPTVGPEARPAPPPPAIADVAPLQLLLVEDDDAVAELTAETLRHLGHDVSRVISAPAALKALEEGLAVDMVLTDVVMAGGQDGLELAQRLRAARPGLPVLLYSGYGGAPARVAAAGLPLLRKPYSLEELRRALVAARDAATRRRPPEA
ncbi:ATP-binding protein [Paracraurococcus lichenis]|uniref:histidine kinase n=1 Tax=Paracraurococcus lichenis TaxID=3064888 RepID=A0ABT9E3E4_9PROT|nr:ATP-binding protein [Paracraurococcus sp. LOR1-02]MDO9710689.1 ATP-binding protein [Paracraurococcus sp. LOR1-02]